MHPSASDHSYVLSITPYTNCCFQLPEEVELIWDDGVAPETCIDFDAGHVSTQEVLGTVAAAFGAIFGLMGIINVVDPQQYNPVAPRSAVIPPYTYERFMAIALPEGADEEAEEAEEEDDE